MKLQCKRDIKRCDTCGHNVTQSDTLFGCNKEKQTMRYTRICSFCSKEFIAHKSCTQYCSHQCSQRAYKARLRDMNRKDVVARDQSKIISEYSKKEVFSLNAIPKKRGY